MRPRVIAAFAAVAAALVALAVVLLPRGGERSEGAESAERPPVDRFDERRAFELLEDQVELGPRPAGSAASRRLAERLERLLPNGRLEPVPGGLRNVVGEVRGREPERVVVVGAHYDTKDLPGFVGANDGASGTATVVELARTIQARELGPTVVFILFDGEESPPGTPEGEFETAGLRGSRAAAPAYRDAEAMILLDFVGDRDLELPREAMSDSALWSQLRDAAVRAGHADAFPPRTAGAISDDHVPFLRAGVPAIDLIDFEFDCFHEPCDDLDTVAPESLDAAGESVLELLRTL